MIPSSLHHQNAMQRQQQQQQQQNHSCINGDSRQMRIFDEKLGFDCLGRGRTNCKNSLLSHDIDDNGKGDDTSDVGCSFENSCADDDKEEEENDCSSSWKTQQPATRAVFRLQKRRWGQRRGRNNNNNRRLKSPFFDMYHHRTKNTVHDLDGLVSKTRQLVVDDNGRGSFSRCEISTSSNIPRKNRSESFETDATQTTRSTTTTTTTTECLLSPKEGTSKATTLSSTSDSIERQFRESMSLSSAECDFESTAANSQTTYDFPIIEWEDDDDDDDDNDGKEDDTTITMNLLSTRIPSLSSSPHDSMRFSNFSPLFQKSPNTTLTSLKITNNSYHSPSTSTSYNRGRRLLRSKSIGEDLVLLLG